MISEEKFLEMTRDMKKIIADYNNLADEIAFKNSFNETKECFAIFIDLGNYMKRKMKQEMTKKIQISIAEEEVICDHSTITTVNKKIHREESELNSFEKNVQSTSLLGGICYPCRDCKFIAPNFKILQGHARLEHAKTEQKICIKCGFESTNHKEFEKHIKIVHPKNEKGKRKQTKQIKQAKKFSLNKQWRNINLLLVFTLYIRESNIRYYMRSGRDSGLAINLYIHQKYKFKEEHQVSILYSVQVHMSHSNHHTFHKLFGFPRTQWT